MSKAPHFSRKSDPLTNKGSGSVTRKIVEMAKFVSGASRAWCMDEVSDEILCKEAFKALTAITHCQEQVGVCAIASLLPFFLPNFLIQCFGFFSDLMRLKDYSIS